MKTFSSIFFALTVILTLQNANARDTVYIQDGDPSNRSYVLWQVKFQPRQANDSSSFIVKIDSVLRGNFFINEEWRALFVMRQNLADGSNIKMNKNYLVLTRAVRFSYSNILAFAPEGDIFLDTPENRKMLSKKWDETTVVYKNPKPSDQQKRDEQWFGENLAKHKSAIKNSDLPIEHALLKVTIKNPNVRIDSVYADTVLLGKIRNGSFVSYFPDICVNVAAGEYLVLIKDFVSAENLMMYAMYDNCPFKDTPENRQKLAKEWEKCQAWGKMKNRKPSPKGQFCGETK